MKENNKKVHRFTAKIADVEPFAFQIAADEEPIFRKAAFHVNGLWQKMQKDQPNRSSHFLLAKVALAFAELYYRKNEQIATQTRLLEDFEQNLDSILLSMD